VAGIQKKTIRRLGLSLLLGIWALAVLVQTPIRRGLDLAGGLAVTLEIAPEALARDSGERARQLDQAKEVMARRIDGLGVVEPLIRSRGDAQIEIQLAGIFGRDHPNLVETIKKPARLEFRLVHAPGTGEAPPGYEWVSWDRADGPNGEGEGGDRRLLLKRIPELTGRAVRRAVPVVNGYGAHEVNLELTAAGARRFERLTEQNVGRPLAIVLDGRIQSAPVIRSAIPDGRASISGRFSREEAIRLANALNNPLEFELRVVEVRELGPSLAEDTRAASLRAIGLGAALVILFMVGYYALGGLVAVLAVALNVLLILGALATFGATLTLPSLAALVLTIGMAVDANIITFARMAEELRRGKSLRQALVDGSDRSFATIVDANLTTLLVAAILFFHGIGAVRGFGLVLAIGILTTLFCSLVFCRGLLDLLVHLRPRGRLFPIFSGRPPRLDFLRRRRLAYLLSGITVAAGLFAAISRGPDLYAMDFTGGDELLLSFRNRPSLQELRALAERRGLGEVQFTFQRSLDGDSEQLRVQTVPGQGDVFWESAGRDLASCQLQLLQKTHIGGAVGAEMRRNAVLSLGLALLGILAYVAIRFESGFAVGAIVSTAHDVLASAGLFFLLGHRLSAPMVAAILMVVGYSINDTIIIFDRIREELRTNGKLSLAECINLAINATLSRTLLTSFTTFLAAFSLYIFAAGVIVDFALVFLLGIFTGTFSSIFIASPIFYRWHRGQRDGLDRKGRTARPIAAGD
jgi:SecD/SecF fusion protein